MGIERVALRPFTTAARMTGNDITARLGEALACKADLATLHSTPSNAFPSISFMERPSIPGQRHVHGHYLQTRLTQDGTPTELTSIKSHFHHLPGYRETGAHGENNGQYDVLKVSHIGKPGDEPATRRVSVSMIPRESEITPGERTMNGTHNVHLIEKPDGAAELVFEPPINAELPPDKAKDIAKRLRDAATNPNPFVTNGVPEEIRNLWATQ